MARADQIPRVEATVAEVGIGLFRLYAIASHRGAVLLASQIVLAACFLSAPVLCSGRPPYVPEEKRGQFGYGDLWTWTAIDADSKLMIGWLVGTRDTDAAHAFMMDVSNRLANRVQLTTDGHRAYLDAVIGAFGTMIDYAMLVKQYGTPSESTPERRYSPAICLGTDPTIFTHNSYN